MAITTKKDCKKCADSTHTHLQAQGRSKYIRNKKKSSNKIQKTRDVRPTLCTAACI